MSVFRSLHHTGTALVSAIVLASAAAGQVVPPPGYIYDPLLLGAVTQNCVAAGPGGTFVGIGPGFTANAQAVVLAKESGETRLVAFGFSSIGDCFYDRANDVLYVTDNADNSDLGITTSFGNTGAQSGDTVFAVPSASSPAGLAAVGLEVVPTDTIEFASSVVVDSNGDVLVGNAAGGGSGEVLRIDLSGPTLSTFTSGFDFTGGLAVNPTDGNVFVAESLPSFDSQLSEFTPAGAVVSSPLLGPSFGFGSVDLAFNADGSLLSTGVFFGDVVSIDVSAPAFTPFISGLTFAGAISVDPFTRRIEILSSTFTGADEDKSIHRFTPIDGLVRGGGSAKTDCLVELYGIELVPKAPGRPARQAICVDGEACDADGEANDRCLFPVGFCVNVDDPSLPDCNSANPIVAFEASAKPFSASVADTQASAATELPLASSSCLYSDGVTVPVKVRPNGKRGGKATVYASAESSDGRTDRDRVTLVCEPAGA